ncbi:MAG: tetratricopeptide repeat protein [Cyanobacteria bacterium SZAS-4]|nr:tetratricopeptide repeat protein [Cyanobacteria bacterium SZAS-4]
MSNRKRFGLALSGIALLTSLNTCVGNIDAAKSAETIELPRSMVAGKGAVEEPSLKHLMRGPRTREDDPALPMVQEACGKSDKGDLKGAIALCTEALKKYPNSALAYAWRGSFEYALRQYAEALADENKALSFAPNYAFALKVRAAIHIYGTPQDNLSAMEDLSKSLANDASDANTWYFRGYVRFHANNLVDALPDFCAANDLWGGWYFSHYYRGITLVSLGLHSSPIAQLDAEQAIKLDPKSGDAYWLLGCVYEHTNKKSEAKEQYQKALDAYTAMNDTTNLQMIKDCLKRCE